MPLKMANGHGTAAAAFFKCLVGFLLMAGPLRAIPVGIPLPRFANDDPFAHNRLQEATPTPVYLPPTPSPDLNFVTPAPRKGSALHAVQYMQKFGYVQKADKDAEFIFTSQALEKAIKRMQKFGDIPQTGLVDNATIELMETPRCGLPDVDPEDIDGDRHIRRKRYILGSKGWDKRRLTYHVANWSPKLWSMENVKKELRRAFDAWSTYSHLQFTEVAGSEADIILYFASYDHYDGYSFDGPSGILAHAYYPYEFGHYGGDVHFDESEEWTIDPKDEYSGLDFFTVAVHEIGHSLGLAHSPVSGSIMFPYYKGYNKDFALDYDDVMAMWELYIKRKLKDDDIYFNTTTTTTTAAPSTSGEDDDDDEHQSDAAGGGGGETDEEGGKSGDDEVVLSDEPRGDHDDDSANDDDDSANDDNDDKYNDDDEDHVRYHGDSETVDEHQKRVSGGQDDLPVLPTLSPEGDGVHERDEEEERKRREEEGRRRDREHEEERRRWEEEIRKKEAETRKKEEEARRRWEDAEQERRPPTTTAKPPPPIPDLCHGSYDAVAVLRQEIFIFKGQYFWRYMSRGTLRPGYPSLITSLFSDLPPFLKKIDAVYERQTDSSIVFFIGKYYYVHNGDRLIEDSPRPLSDLGIPDLYTKIDAAFYWPRAKRTYFFSRNSYFRYDDVTKKMDSGYPKDIKKWNGIPGDLDAVFTWDDGSSYFLRGYQYWQYDNAKIRPSEGYPQEATQYWAACPAKS